MHTIHPGLVSFIKPFATESQTQDFCKSICDNLDKSNGIPIRFYKINPLKNRGDRLAVSTFSGWFVTNQNSLFLTVILPNLSSVTTKAKKIKNAIKIILPFNGENGTRLHFKLKRLFILNSLKVFIYSIQTHYELFTESSRGIASNPYALGLKVKNQTWEVEIEEPSYLGSLDLLIFSRTYLNQEQAPVVYTSEDLLKALRDVAHGLKFIHEKGYAHLDVKLANIFISNDLKGHLGDFELVWPIGQKKIPELYFAWHVMMTYLGIATPDSDVFGFAMALGVQIFGSAFARFTIDIVPLYNSNFDLYYIELLIANNFIERPDPSLFLNDFLHIKPGPDSPTLFKQYALAYAFIKKILNDNIGLLNLLHQRPDIVSSFETEGEMRDMMVNTITAPFTKIDACIEVCNQILDC